ncbi:phosphotransferase [Ruegeria pomeroyi]|nr:phosphotransferase [Ruegeria pomeroyi]
MEQTEHIPPPGLVAQLRERGLLQNGDRFETLYGGRTNRVWRLLGPADDLVVKLYRRDFDNPLFGNDAQLEALCLNQLQGTGLAPQLRASGTLAQEAWVVYDHAPGDPWQSDPTVAARILANLHRRALDIPAPVGCNGSAAIGAHAEAILARCTHADRELLQKARPQAATIDPGPTCLIHGDPVAGNLLVSGNQAILIDWQCPAISDPAEDLAMFLSPAMQQVYRGAPLTAAEEQQFLSAYATASTVARYLSLKPWFHWRMAAYCLWRARNGAPDYAPAFELESAALAAC